MEEKKKVFIRGRKGRGSEIKKDKISLESIVFFVLFEYSIAMGVPVINKYVALIPRLP